MFEGLNEALKPMIDGNPDVEQNDILKTIQSGDLSKCQQIGQNMCKSYGVAPEQAAQQAMNWARSNPAMAPILKSLGLS